MQYLRPDFTQGLRSRQPAIDAALLPWVERLWLDGTGYNLRPKFSWRKVLTLSELRGLSESVFSRRLEHTDRAAVALFRTILAEARTRVHGWGGRLYFVFVPRWERYFRPAALANRDTRAAVLDVVRSLDLPIIDLDQVIRTTSDPELLYARQELAAAHFSPKGYELFAQAVIRVLESEPRLISNPGTPSILSRPQARAASPGLHPRTP
jgi:hypothetical protein